MPDQSATQPDISTFVLEAQHVAISTARMPAVLREAYRNARVTRYLGLLSPEEIESAHRVCGYLPEVGWNVLSRTLGLVTNEAGQLDRTLEGEHGLQGAALPLYEPRLNYGGWVRIFRLEAARMPKTESVIQTLVQDGMLKASEGPDGAERVKGAYGLSPFFPVTEEALAKAIPQTDLFTAPWMAAMWTPGTQWVVLGPASDLVSGVIRAGHPAADDLSVRAFADQVPSIDAQGRPRFYTGPRMGILAVIDAVELALRNGYRLDVVPQVTKEPVQWWTDGHGGLGGEAPLMGLSLRTRAAAWLVTLVREQQNWRLGGLAKEDFEAFQMSFGVDPTQRITEEDIESLVWRGTPVYGRIPSFAPAAGNRSRKEPS